MAIAMTSDNKLAALRQVLGAVDQSGNDDFEQIPVHVFDTAFVAVNTALSQINFFSGAAPSPQYRTQGFPSQTQAFRFTHVKFYDQLRFTASDPLRHTQYIEYYLNNSTLVITNEGNEVITVPMNELVHYRIYPSNNVAGTTATYRQVDTKFTNTYMLPKPIIFNAGESPVIQLNPASSISTAATWVANVDPYLVNTGVASDQAYPIRIELIGTKSKAKR